MATAAASSKAPVAAASAVAAKTISSVAKTVADLAKPQTAKTTTAEQTAKKPKSGADEDLKAELLRRIAEMAGGKLYILEMVRTTIEAMDAASDDASLGWTSSSEDWSANEASVFERSTTARSNASAYAFQMQAYHENA